MNRNRRPSTFRRRSRTLGAVACALFLAFGAAGCGGGKTAVTERQRKEAEHLVAEANFALSLRDWARAEGLLVQAVAVVPGQGDYWVALGSARMRLGNKGGARDAYGKALKAYEQEAAAEEARGNPEPWLGQVYALAVMGRVGDARSLTEKMAKQFPRDPRVRAFVDGKQLDQILADPQFKEAAL